MIPEYKSVDYYIDRDDGDIYRYLMAARATYVKEVFNEFDREWVYIGIECKLPTYPWVKKLTETELFAELL